MTENLQDGYSYDVWLKEFGKLLSEAVTYFAERNFELMYTEITLTNQNCFCDQRYDFMYLRCLKSLPVLSDLSVETLKNRLELALKAQGLDDFWRVFCSGHAVSLMGIARLDVQSE